MENGVELRMKRLRAQMELFETSSGALDELRDVEAVIGDSYEAWKTNDEIGI